MSKIIYLNKSKINVYILKYVVELILIILYFQKIKFFFRDKLNYNYGLYIKWNFIKYVKQKIKDNKRFYINFLKLCLRN